MKLLFSAITLGVLLLAGKRYFTVGMDVPLASFTLALLFVTLSIVSMGFLIASVVPTARFAQPIGTLVFYPMIVLSDLFVPVDSSSPLLQAIARVLPLGYAVSLLRGIWQGEGWLAHGGEVAALTVMVVVCGAASTKVFRWE